MVTAMTNLVYTFSLGYGLFCKTARVVEHSVLKNGKPCRVNVTEWERHKVSAETVKLLARSGIISELETGRIKSASIYPKVVNGRNAWDACYKYTNGKKSCVLYYVPDVLKDIFSVQGFEYSRTVESGESGTFKSKPKQGWTPRAKNHPKHAGKKWLVTDEERMAREVERQLGRSILGR